MASNSLSALPEVFVSDTSMSRMVNRAVNAGDLRKIASRLYTRNLNDDPEVIVRRHIWQIVAGYFPEALIADRTALENAPAKDGSICLITANGGDIKLPGIVIRPRRGVTADAEDRPFIAGLRLSSVARAYLENMRPSRRSRDGLVPRTLTRQEIEERLEGVLRRGGEQALNQLRDQVRAVASSLNMEAEAEAFDALAGALLGTRQAELTSPIARARYAGRPYDPNRLELFHTLHKALRNTILPPRIAPSRNTTQMNTLAFFEAYFSNFIEGTEFEVKEAADIVFQGHIPVERPQDAHDVLGTWRIVSDHDHMQQVPSTAAMFFDLLRHRHAEIMQARPDTSPGQFKQFANRAGQTHFVAPDLVEGTLQAGFEIYQSLGSAFERAVFMMFLVSEVHPFADGNGRTARIMMNAGLIAAGEERIIIPTIYRANYLSALKALSLTGNPDALVRALDYAQQWTHTLPWDELYQTQQALQTCHAFMQADSAEEQGIRLRLFGGKVNNVS